MIALRLQQGIFGPPGSPHMSRNAYKGQQNCLALWALWSELVAHAHAFHKFQVDATIPSKHYCPEIDKHSMRPQ